MSSASDSGSTVSPTRSAVEIRAEFEQHVSTCGECERFPNGVPEAFCPKAVLLSQAYYDARVRENADRWRFHGEPSNGARGAS